MFGKWPTDLIDHINGVRFDNRICNLREATHVENCRNQKMYKNNSSGVKGISWNKPAKKWQVACACNGKRYHLGLFKDIHVAEQAIKEFREKYHGDFSNHGTVYGGKNHA